METPKVSIILPVYNAGPYLTKCLDSLVNQTLKDIEIICVLDCPTDGSDKTVYEYAALDNRIKVIANEKNLHIGLSRNVGLRNATGEYIGFVDHDDYLELNMYELLYEIAKEKNAMISSCLRDTVNVIKHEIRSSHNTNGMSCKNLLVQILVANNLSTSFVVWNKLYSRDFIARNNFIFFDTKVYSNEDAYFNFQIYLELIANNMEVAYISNTLYHHVYHTNNEGGESRYLLNQINFREKISETILSNGSLNKIYMEELYIGNSRLLYTMFRHRYFKLSQLKSFPNICSNIKECWSLYHRDLTIPKNIFGVILRLLLLKK